MLAGCSRAIFQGIKSHDLQRHYVRNIYASSTRASWPRRSRPTCTSARSITASPPRSRSANTRKSWRNILNEGYVSEYEFGYQKDGKRLVTWRYKVDENGTLTTDERPGKVVPYVDVAGAYFFNFLTPQFPVLSTVQRPAGQF